jgi:hypothetical protein
MTIATMPRLRSRRFPHLPKRMIVDYSVFAAIVVGPALVGVMALTLIVSFFRPIEASGWDLSQQLANWFVFGTLVHVGTREFWLYVTHGQTRRNFFGEVSIFLVAFACVMAIFYAAGFWIEAPYYWVMGWPQTAHQPTLFTDVLVTHLVVLESWLTYLLWGAAGLFIGVAFYRNGLVGALAIGASLLAAQTATLAMGHDAGPVGALIRGGALPSEPNVVAAVLAHIACAAALMGLAWLVMRDAPIHSRAK